MLTVHATLLPNGQVQLPPGLARSQPLPVLVTILEPADESDRAVATSVAIDGAPSENGSVAKLLALLASPEFQALPQADASEVEQRIQAIRNDWAGD
jgi:hypothetical protein